MKLLSIAVPCYNSEDYIRHCVESLLPGGEDVEILLVDDGSTKDRTPEIIDEYAEKYPTIVRAIHQENKGHGGAVNTGIDNATGMYFKVVDSDDWVDQSAYEKILQTLDRLVRGPETVDVLFSNFVYEKEGAKHKRVIRYVAYFPQNKTFGWDQMRHMGETHYVLMHSIIYRTELLREVGLRLPEHTFYVDNIYAFEPFCKVNRMYYLNVDFYRYYIGRADQSVNEKVMMGRIDQQLRVNEEMIRFYGEVKGSLTGRKKEFMIHDVSIITVISSLFLIRIGTPEALEKKNKIWAYLKKVDFYAWFRIRCSALGCAMFLPGRNGRKILLTGYKAVRKIYGFN